MDVLQAAILNYRLTKLDHVISKRRENAQYYFDNLNSTDIKLPVEKDGEFNTYHTFVIQIEQRDKLKDYLKEIYIGFKLHLNT